MSKEILEVLDEEGNDTGETKERGRIHQKELYHPVADVWIYNREGELLMQKRSQNKDIRPQHWGASAAGHIRAGEDPTKEAIREVKEELGIDIEESDLEYVGFYKNDLPIPDTDRVDREFSHTFLLEWNKAASEFEPDSYEVDKVRFFPIEELYNDFTSENPERKYTPSGEYLKMVLDNVKDRLL